MAISPRGKMLNGKDARGPLGVAFPIGQLPFLSRYPTIDRSTIDRRAPRCIHSKRKVSLDNDEIIRRD